MVEEVLVVVKDVLVMEVVMVVMVVVEVMMILVVVVRVNHRHQSPRKTTRKTEFSNIY